MTPLVQSVTDLLSLLTVLGGALFVFLSLALLARKMGFAHGVFESALGFFGKRALLFSFLVALAGVISSLFYSEVAGFPPCVLCWWQRIFLYPQVIILGLALVRKEAAARIYALVLSAAGSLVAAYHSYIFFAGSESTVCPAGVASCTQQFFMEYGYVAIPTMSLTAFLLIIVFLLAGAAARKPAG
ncbi:MAG: putative disulfide formation protein [Parcubacteria group bacterium GW2011_GWB1_56_8]|nr:MAG: putative disulfide formation protein [Parcubacteria group bacterium GW2011_GWB1_56_8]